MKYYVQYIYDFLKEKNKFLPSYVIVDCASDGWQSKKELTQDCAVEKVEEILQNMIEKRWKRIQDSKSSSSPSLNGLSCEKEGRSPSEEDVTSQNSSAPEIPTTSEGRMIPSLSQVSILSELYQSESETEQNQSNFDSNDYPAQPTLQLTELPKEIGKTTPSENSDCALEEVESESESESIQNENSSYSPSAEQPTLQSQTSIPIVLDSVPINSKSSRQCTCSVQYYKSF